jgi:LPXTG-motif cell wall-anchored protein
VRFSRAIVSLLLVLVALAVLGPAAAIAGGPSAGDQQYTDPLAGTNTNGNGSSGSPSGSSGSSSSGSSSSSSSGSASSGSQSSGTPVASSSSSSSTGTAATAGSTSTSSSGSLPMTGFDAALGAVVGIGLLGAGVVVRRRVQRQ